MAKGRLIRSILASREHQYGVLFFEISDYCKDVSCETSDMDKHFIIETLRQKN